MMKAVRDAMERLVRPLGGACSCGIKDHVLQTELQRMYDLGRVAGMREAAKELTPYELPQRTQAKVRRTANALARKVRKGK